MIKKIQHKFLKKMQYFFLFSLGKYIRTFRKLQFPKNPDGKVLIHVGCGEFNDQRFINVDTRPGWHIHVVESIENIDTAFPKKIMLISYMPVTLWSTFRTQKYPIFLRSFTAA